MYISIKSMVGTQEEHTPSPYSISELSILCGLGLLVLYSDPRDVFPSCLDFLTHKKKTNIAF